MITDQAVSTETFAEKTLHRWIQRSECWLNKLGLRLCQFGELNGGDDLEANARGFKTIRRIDFYFNAGILLYGPFDQAREEVVGKIWLAKAALSGETFCNARNQNHRGDRKAVFFTWFLNALIKEKLC